MLKCNLDIRVIVKTYTLRTVPQRCCWRIYTEFCERIVQNCKRYRYCFLKWQITRTRIRQQYIKKKKSYILYWSAQGMEEMSHISNVDEDYDYAPWTDHITRPFSWYPFHSSCENFFFVFTRQRRTKKYARCECFSCTGNKKSCIRTVEK